MAKWRAACLLAACPPPSPPRLDRPSHLPVDNPAGFSYFFDISGRRTCTVAPERFYAPDGKSATTEVCRFNALAPAMDIFSLGCVIYELMTDGKPLFDLPTLLAYREVPAPPCSRTLTLTAAGTAYDRPTPTAALWHARGIDGGSGG